jgi:hypothetical protein
VASNLYLLFKISLLNFFKARVILMEKLHVQPSELDRLPYYELEYTVSAYNEILDERNRKEEENTKKDHDKYNMDSVKSSMTKFSSPKMPSIKMPKF